MDNGSPSASLAESRGLGIGRSVSECASMVTTANQCIFRRRRRDAKMAHASVTVSSRVNPVLLSLSDMITAAPHEKRHMNA